jgi:aminoglycoside phosphotransferase (APT) family kinase protein
VVESISKTRVKLRQAMAIVDAAFGGAVSLTTFAECEEGWFNAVYQLGLSDGTNCILKVAPPPGIPVLRYEHNIMTTEVDALRLVAERTQVPVPEVLAWDKDCTLLSSPYFLMEECSGALLSALRPTLDDDAQCEIDAQIARHIEAINAISAPAFGRPEPSAPHDHKWSAAMEHLVTGHLADAVDAAVELPVSYATFTSILDGYSPFLDVVTTPRVVHWDLGDPNVFVDPESLIVTGLIDFERVLWADPLMEAQFVGKRANDRMTEAYGTAIFDQPYAVERRRFYDLYLYLVMYVECAFRKYPTDDIKHLSSRLLDLLIAEIQAA